jgi:ribosomal protein S18 acetylase RimI-like enzyme
MHTDSVKHLRFSDHCINFRFTPVEHFLDNPVYNALVSGDAHLAQGIAIARYFDPAVSPFAGFPIGYDKGFDDLLEQLPPGRKILYATVTPISEPAGWQQMAYIKGAQFLYESDPGDATGVSPTAPVVPLTHDNAAEMVQLAALTKPGPFDMRTIEFGSYYGIFENGVLAAMTGQRLHVYDYAEVSAVCTHPQFLGKGYATVLLRHQLNLILQAKKIPFLHVREDNARAIAVYERLGFKLRGPMHFYFLKRRD